MTSYRHCTEHATHDYPRAVADGVLPVGALVRQACQRHVADLAHGPARGLWFDAKAADAALRFFAGLRFTKGRWGRQTFVPQGWQTFLIGAAFGWKKADGFRRFREVHVEVGRKNGKTETAAGVALKLAGADGEHGAEVYCLATKRDQARTTFDAAKRLVAGGPFQKLFRRMKHEVTYAPLGSKLVPLGADADTLDSLNVHGAIKDELHAWKDRALWDVIDTATGARDQPMGFVTTTAGYNRLSVWWERRELAVKLLAGDARFQNDEFFPLIYTPDDGDDWQDEGCWHKGNPNLGVTIRLDELRLRAAEAAQSGAAVNAFRRLRLNQPTETATRWLNMALWRAAADPVPESALAGRPCFLGLDLSLTTDLTALALVFPPTDADPVWRVVVRHFLPRAGVADRESRDRVPYRQWADGCRLTLTDGDWVDYEVVMAQVLADAERFKVLGLAYDRQYAPALVQRLIARGVRCVPWGQGYYGLNTGTKEFNRLLVSRQLKHAGCPLLEWQAGNAVIEMDAAGNQKPNKAKSTCRIDGLAASITGLSLASHEYGTEPPDAGLVEFDLQLGW